MNLKEINDSFTKKITKEVEEQRDKLHMAEGPLSFVYGFGFCSSGIVVIGEAPGKDEVIEGRPFVGKAGGILNQLLGDSGIERDNLYITNTIKYRLARNGSRPGTLANRPASAFEIKLSAPWLYEELKCINPRLIITLGNVPLECMSYIFNLGQGKQTISSLHGKEILLNNEYISATFVPLYHPASLIYNRSLADDYAKDMEHVAKLIKL